MLALDVETTGLDWWSPDFRVFMAQWHDGAVGGYCTEDDGWGKLHAVLAKHDTLVGANFGFDVHALRASGIVDLTASGHRLHDVLLLARVAVPGRFSYRLKDVGEALVGADAKDEQTALKTAAKKHGVPWTLKNKDFYALWRAEPDLMAEYGVQDVALTRDLWNRIWLRALKSDVEVYRMEMAGVWPLLHASERDGVLVDQERLAVLEDQLKSGRDELRGKLLLGGLRETALGVEVEHEDADEDAEPEYGKSTPAHLREDLLALGIPLYRLTATSGKPALRKGEPVYTKNDAGKVVPKINGNTLAVNKDALAEFESAYPVVGDLLAWRNRCKILQTYVAPLKEAAPRIHTSFSQAAARTSRMSSSRPNMQNLPTKEKEREDGSRAMGVRDVLIPAPGNAFIAADFDSIEVRALAHYIADPELIAQLNGGMDLHQRTAYRVAAAQGQACRFEDFVKGGPRDKDRTIAKITTFCVPQEGSEILTRRGWLRHDEVAVGDETLGYKDGESVWTPVLGVHRFADAEVLSVGHSSFTARCTPGHRWLADRRGWANGRAYTQPALEPLESLTSEHRLLVSAPAEGGGLDITPDEAAIIAWVFTDGSLRISPLGTGPSQAGGRRQHHGATIIQSKEPHRAAIRLLLERNGALVSESVRAVSGCSVFKLPSAYVRELWRRAGVTTKRDDMTAFVLGLSAAARTAFVQACMAAEGHVTAAGRRTFSQNEGALLDAFQLAAWMQGDRATVRGRGVMSGGNAPHGSVVLKRPQVGMQRWRQTPAGREPVWCVSTELGSWTMRQGSDIMLTGNTSMYGGGARLLAVRLGVSVEAAAAIKGATLDAIGGYHEFDERVKRTVLKRSFPHVTTITGRRLHVPLAKPYVALNTLIQGTSADLMKLAMIAAAPALAEYGWTVRLVVHDELLSEGPAGCVEAVMAAKIESMESCYPLSPRLVVSAAWSVDSYGAAK